jgi:hypothetical protein
MYIYANKIVEDFAICSHSTHVLLTIKANKSITVTKSKGPIDVFFCLLHCEGGRSMMSQWKLICLPIIPSTYKVPKFKPCSAISSVKLFPTRNIPCSGDFWGNFHKEKQLWEIFRPMGPM